MSDTLHHRKPGQPRTPRKQYLKHGRADAKLRTGMLSGITDLDTSESMVLRRTR